MSRSSETGDSVLVVGPSWVGDMVMAQSLFRLLAAARPERPIDVLAPGWSLPIVARMPEVRRGIALDVAHGEVGWGKRRQVASALEPYRQAIVLPRSLKAALVPFFARIPVRTGFRGEGRFWLINDMRPFDRSLLDQTVKRFVALGLEPGERLPERLPEPRLEVDVSRQAELRETLGLDSERPAIALMPGAEYGPAKCWPLEYFAELAESLGRQGYAVWVLGSQKDAEAGAVISRNSDARNLCGKTALADAVDLLGMAEQAVSNDSGLMHVAAAAGCYTHGIYGSSSPAFTPPLSERRHIHYRALDCSPCFERTCPLGHLNCLREITPSDVLKSIEHAQT